MRYEFVIADVFAQEAFGGNQLAVIPDARGLSERLMQSLANEFGFSETTFVLPPRDPCHTRQVRIFTPTQELPFAGHPTVGTASVLAADGHVPVEPGQSFVLEEGVGPVTVETAGTFSRLIATTAFEAPYEQPPRQAIAASLSLDEKQLRGCWYGSVGLPFCYVHLDSIDSVDAAFLDQATWNAELANRWSPNLYFFAGELRDGASIYARAFVPAFGIAEDPATGSAAAGLVAHLAVHAPEPTGSYRVQINQGVRMGRSSFIECTAEKENGQLIRTSVGGHTTIMARGTLDLEGKPPTTG
ncbi:PhzF family phenazine biosynthesis protein [Fodinicola acaciae]|uniref:PhzF family phenazine biosynthesis protein n=1 Tax=Fodinicola acaciae TaxID=2681555 RepID=UPI0013D171D3|nr:PhzF family phenazine biosynthesis protein [Fodinicola acaciae]